MISEMQLDAVCGWLEHHADKSHLEQALRAAFPDLHFTFCQDDDVMLDGPARGSSRFNLYMVDSSSHCLSLTTDIERASGLVVAERDDV